MSFEPIIAGIVANFVTKYVKPSKVGMTAEQQTTRKNLVRVINAVLGIVGLVAVTLLTGAELDVTSLTTYIEVIITFLVSQGMYFMAKSQ